MWCVRIGLLAGLVFLAGPGAHGADTVHDIAGPDAAYPVSRRVQYGFTVQNRSNRLIETAELWAYAPVRQTPTQKTLRLLTSDPAERTEDELGNQILHFSFANLPPRAIRVVRVRAELALCEGGGEATPTDPQTFLGPEPRIEADHPEIVQLASRLQNAESAATARNVFRWVVSNITYAGYLGDDRGALYALRNRKGDCTEFAYLFVALCRAAGVPARAIAGYVVAEDGLLRREAYHNWAEFHDGTTWQLADPQGGRFMEHPAQYLATQILGAPPGGPLANAHRFRCQPAELDVRWN